MSRKAIARRPNFRPLWSIEEGRKTLRDLMATDSAVTMAELASAQLLGWSSNEMLGRSDHPDLKTMSDLLQEGTEALKSRLACVMEAHRRLLVCAQYTHERSGSKGGVK